MYLLLQDIEIRQCLCGEKLSTECAGSQVEKEKALTVGGGRNTVITQREINDDKSQSRQMEGSAQRCH